MTFTRAFLMAMLAGSIARTHDPETTVILIGLFWVAWEFTTDPLPGAIRKALDDYAKDYRR